MMNTKLFAFIAIIVLAGVGGYFLWQGNEPRPIGGDRDEHGCLVAAGYAFSEDVGACIRSFEMTPDIMQAAKMAVDHVGRGYALTVASFNSYEEVGAYDIMLEKGEAREREIVAIRGNNVVDRKEVVFACKEGKSISAVFYIGYDKYVELSLSDGRIFSVPRAISASGARYTADDSFVFWNKGDTAFIMENGVTTFADCALTK